VTTPDPHSPRPDADGASTDTSGNRQPDHLAEVDGLAPLSLPASPPATAGNGRPRPPRLERHVVEIDGHKVVVAVCGRGLPLVLVHGWSAEGALYAHTLARLVEQGYQVITIDWAGYGRRDEGALSDGASTLSGYHRLLALTLSHLGIRRAVLAGHSMGGRLVVDLAVDDPELVIAIVLIDAAVGEPWDRLMQTMRAWPPAALMLGAAIAVDAAATTPMQDPRHALRLGRALVPTMVGHVRRPRRLAGPAFALISGNPSVPQLVRLRDMGVPVVVLHADRDIVVPLASGRSAATILGTDLVVVKGGGHSWLIKDPEALPAIMRRLRAGVLGQAIDDAVRQVGRARQARRSGRPGGPVPPAAPVGEDLERLFTWPGAVVLDLAGPSRELADDAPHRASRYEFEFHPRA
jgi:pimeloyl-ACP methyl ester carboxylesterase